MNTSTSKHNQVPSVVSPSNTNETKARKLETGNHQILNDGSSNTGSGKFVEFCKESTMCLSNVGQLGEPCFQL